MLWLLIIGVLFLVVVFITRRKKVRYCVGDTRTPYHSFKIAKGEDCSDDTWTQKANFDAYDKEYNNTLPWCVGSKPLEEGSDVLKYQIQSGVDCAGDGWEHDLTFYTPSESKNTIPMCSGRANYNSSVFLPEQSNCSLTGWTHEHLLNVFPVE